MVGAVSEGKQGVGFGERVKNRPVVPSRTEGPAALGRTSTTQQLGWSCWETIPVTPEDEKLHSSVAF